MDYKKIYARHEALVSEDLIKSSDDVIDATIPDAPIGMVIYTVGKKVAKQKSLDGTWVSVQTVDDIIKSFKVFDQDGEVVEE